VLPATLVTAGLIGQIYQSVGRDVDGKGMRRTHNPYLPAIHEWINYAIENRATDIHIEIKGVTGKVRFRVDGELEIMRTSGEGQYPSSFLQSCMSTLYNNEQQRNSGSDALFDPGTMVYCMVPYDEIKGHKLKLRYQSLKGSEGPKVVLRLLNADDSAPTLTFEQLGYEKSQINLWRQAMQTPSGTCVIAGITGSGKSTTQKSFIELNPDLPSMCVFTLEDPIEYPLKNVHQIHLQRNLTNEAESAMKFNEAITAIMRADPDAVMVGEVRDVDSANALIQIAESGHFAMATTHTHLMSGIVPRLTNTKIGLSRHDLCAPNILTLLVYQALVPILCPKCSLSTEIASEKNETISQYVRYVTELELDASILKWRKPGGCPHCKARGTVGLTVVAEMLIPDEDWLKVTRESKDAEAVAVYRSQSDRNLESSDMTGKTVFEHTLYKALQGGVDVRQCSRFEIFERYVRGHRARKNPNY
jgi:type II secretory ATPase GspE/PulE/Tfp pilus assembly ATPase PilB-like protein